MNKLHFFPICWGEKWAQSSVCSPARRHSPLNPHHTPIKRVPTKTEIPSRKVTTIAFSTLGDEVSSQLICFQAVSHHENDKITCVFNDPLLRLWASSRVRKSFEFLLCENHINLSPLFPPLQMWLMLPLGNLKVNAKTWCKGFQILVCLLEDLLKPKNVMICL